MEQQAYGTVFENVADALLIHCPNSGKILDVNQRFCDLSGYEREPLVGELVDQIMTGQELYAEHITEDALAALRDGEPLRAEWTLETSDGQQIPVEVIVKLVELDGNVRALSSVRDISERREHQRQRRRFQQAIEAAGHAVYITDENGRIEYVNPAFEEITGYGVGEAIGATPSLLDPDDRPEQPLAERWPGVFEGAIWKEELTNETSDGDHYHARQTVAPLTDDSGAVDGFVVIQTDITEQEHQAKRFGALLENAMALISLVDGDGRIQFASPSVERFLDIDPAEMEGAPLTEYVHPDDREEVLGWLERARQNPGEPVRNEARLRHASGTWRVFESIANNQLDNPAVEGIVVNSRDVTERRDRERQLRVLDRLLRHNLRNDMNVVTGLADQIRATGPPELQSAADRISDTVEGLMATAEKERRVVDIISERANREQFDVVPRIRRGVTEGIDGREANLTVDLPEEAEVVALSEIEQVIAELVENAVVHATDQPPTVAVSATVEPDRVDVRITDKGPPIPDEEIEVLTATRIDALNHGSGIGLWLVNWVVSRSEGQLFFERREDGNVVTVRLPRPEQ